MSDGKSVADALSAVLYDREAAEDQGVGNAKQGSCAVVQRACTLMYQAVHALFSKHEDDIRQYWAQSNDKYPVLYRQIMEVQWPTMARENVKGGVNR